MSTSDITKDVGCCITRRRDGGGFAVKHNGAAVGRGRRLDGNSPATGQRACFLIESSPLSRMVGQALEASPGKLAHLYAGRPHFGSWANLKLGSLGSSSLVLMPSIDDVVCGA